MQEASPPPDAADKYLPAPMARLTSTLDANDFLYAVDSSRNYDPSSKLETIKAHVMYINSADDFINPPELAIPEREIKRVKHSRIVLLPASEQTFVHVTPTHASVLQSHLHQLH